MKMERELLRVLVDNAREGGIGPSTLARELFQEGLLSRGARLSNESLVAIISNRLRDNLIRPVDAYVEAFPERPKGTMGNAMDKLPAKIDVKAESAHAAGESMWPQFRKAA